MPPTCSNPRWPAANCGTIRGHDVDGIQEVLETDAALKRRFQVVKVDEPDIPRGIAMMRGLAAVMESTTSARARRCAQ